MAEYDDKKPDDQNDEQPLDGYINIEDIGGKRDDDQDETEEDREARFAQLDSFGGSLGKHRSASISARQVSGIEEIWLEDEEFYEGIDEANRSSEKRTDWRQKPPGQTSGLNKSTTRSSVFPNITAPFVDAATARLSDVVLPVGGQAPWSFDPTPVPELIKQAEGDFPELPDIDYNNPDAVMQQAEAENLMMEDAKRTLDEAKKRAQKAEKRIFDWHVECNRKNEVRLVIEDAGRMGVGIIKGPFNQASTRVAYVDGKVEKVTKVVPASRRIDPWNFFPSADCGENIQHGDGVWERDYITKKQLREFLDDENYIPEQVMRCLNEGPTKAEATYKETPEPIMDPNLKDKYEIWYFHGTAEQEELEAGGCDCTDIEDPHIPAMITMINNHVIRAALNPLDTGHYPYSTFSWRRRSGHWAGIGVGRQVRVAQKVVIGGTRNLMDNAGLAAGPMLVFKQGAVRPADGVAGIAPRKVFYIAEDEDGIQDATKAIGSIKVDMLVDELLKIIQFGMKLAEDTTGMPMLLQGQMGSAPDTVGGLRILQNNTAPPLRRLARAFDDDLQSTEIERYYVYLLLYGENDDEKGDFFINTMGSTTLVERDLQDRELGSMAHIVIDPRYGADPAKWFDEFLKSRRFDPQNFMMDEEGQAYQDLVQKASEPAPDPREAIAQLQAQVKGAEIQSKEGIEMAKMQLNAELEVWNREQDQMELEAEKQIQMILANQEGQLSIAKTQSDREEANEKMKADIGQLVMKIRSQERLAGIKATQDRMPMKPPNEPPGRASPGNSVQQ